LADTGADRWRTELRKQLARLPNDFASAKAGVEALSHAFHQEIAEALGPKLAAYLKTVPQATYENRKLLSSWCNHELHALHLCIRCPKTGRPSILVADIRGTDDDTSRFRLQSRGEEGQAIRTYTSKELPYFELMEDPPRREGASRWPGGQGRQPPGR
jgi:hypothetical protein